MAVTESMGYIMDRSHEHLGTSDKAIIRARRMLIDAARNLESGIEPPGLDPNGAWHKIRSAERNIAPDDDWRKLGTDEDPMVQEIVAAIAQ
jgi:phthalate 4,5-dioxygenase